MQVIAARQQVDRVPALDMLHEPEGGSFQDEE
jgi:hypothetical protein